MSDRDSSAPTQREPGQDGGAVESLSALPGQTSSPATSREGGDTPSRATAWEEPSSSQLPSGGSVPTSREGSDDVAAGWVPVPSSLQQRFRYEGPVASSGGEANLYRVRSVEHPDRELLLKLYLGSVQLDPDALEAIGSMGRSDVVGVVEYGRVLETGYWYEVQEYLSHGDLLSLLDTHSVPCGERRSLHPRMVREVLGQLHDALQAFHRAVGPHHDLKPSNVLVRTPPPDLQLALGDFGLAMATDRSVIYQSRRAGTIAYDSPESLGAGQGGVSRDWWALGMTIAHLAGGRHPFEHHATGGMLTDAAIRDHLHNRRPIDLDAVTDAELNTLCRGLTRYNPDHRWGSEEIAAWRQGHTVAVVSEQPAAPPPSPAPANAAGIDLVGRRHTTRGALARALANDWRAAAGKLGNATARQQFVDDIAATFGGHRLEQLDADWAQQTTSVDRAITDLIVALDPTVSPAVAGWDVSQQGLGDVVRTALADSPDRQAAARLIDSLHSNELLAVLAHLDGQQELWTTNERWRQASYDLQHYLQQAHTRGVELEMDVAQIRATLLGAVVDATFRAELASQRGQVLRDHPDARSHPAMSPLTKASEPSAAQDLAVVLLAAPAATQVRQEREREQEQQRQQQREEHAREQSAERDRLAELRRRDQEAAQASRARNRNIVADAAIVIVGGIVVFFPTALLAAFPGAPDHALGPVRENLSSLRPVFYVAVALTLVGSTIVNMLMPPAGPDVPRALKGWEFVPGLQLLVPVVASLGMGPILAIVGVDPESPGLQPFHLLPTAVAPIATLLVIALTGGLRQRRPDANSSFSLKLAVIPTTVVWAMTILIVAT